MRWDPELAVGVPEIDGQHQELFRRAAALVEGLRDSRGRQQISALIPYLHGYVIEHFDAEEKLMALHGYPRAAEHGAQHRKFTHDIGVLQKEMEAGNATAALALKTSQFLEHWLRHHISISDQALGAFLLARQGRDALTLARALAVSR